MPEWMAHAKEDVAAASAWRRWDAQEKLVFSAHF